MDFLKLEKPHLIHINDNNEFELIRNEFLFKRRWHFYKLWVFNYFILNFKII